MTSPRIVVDGSNIATEGRTTPSLVQLDEAVRALMEEYPHSGITVVVDATFGHRIDPSERDTYEEAVLAGELVSPPAGAIGRGDAFVLQIADKADATVFSNDSFQEFHGHQYDWLFDEGRLVGGKPVPEVGWVFVLRTPVRGPTSRRATREARSSTKAVAKKSVRSVGEPIAEAGTSEPARGGRRKKAAPAASVPPPQSEAARAATDSDDDGSARRRRRTGKAPEPVNDPATFLHFVSDHPVGAVVEGTVDRFSSHGAYVEVGSAQCYIPLRLMADPSPTSAKQVLTVGETRTFVVDAFDTPRRSIDLSVPGMAAVETGESPRLETEEAALAAEPPVPDQDPDQEETSMAAAKTSTKKAPARKQPAKKATTGKATAAANKAVTAAKKATAEKATAQKAASRASASASTAKAAAKKATTAVKKATAKKAPAKTAPAKKVAAIKKAAGKTAPAKKVAAIKKAAGKTAPAKKVAAIKKAATKKAPAKKSVAAKAAPAAKKTTAKAASTAKKTTRKAPAKQA